MDLVESDLDALRITGLAVARGESVRLMATVTLNEVLRWAYMVFCFELIGCDTRRLRRVLGGDMAKLRDGRRQKMAPFGDVLRRTLASDLAWQDAHAGLVGR